MSLLVNPHILSHDTEMTLHDGTQQPQAKS